MIANMIVSIVDCKLNDTNKVANRDPMYVNVKGKRSFEKVCFKWLTGPKRKAKLVIIIMLPTVKNMQNFLALNNRKGIYIEDMRKHEMPEPRQTAKQISLCVADSLKVKRFQKLGPLEVVSSFINDLNEYCELNILDSSL